MPTVYDMFMMQRRATAANWTSVNPTLRSGEIGLESDTRYMKIGDGVLQWNALAYFFPDPNLPTNSGVALGKVLAATLYYPGP